MNVTPSSVDPAPHLRREDVEDTIPARFDKIAALLPDHPAMSDGEVAWSYGELKRRADQLAQFIAARVPAGGCVAITLPRPRDVILLRLATLKAGAVSLAIHPDLPDATRRALIEDARPDLILDDLPDDDTPWSPRADVSPASDAVVYYTSGTTGLPKGVVKSHRAILHRAWLYAEETGVTPADRQSLLSSSSFAASESDTFGALLNGATLCPFDVAARGFAAFRDWLNEEGITLLHPPVQLFRKFLATLDDESFPQVRVVALAGETVRAEDVAGWQRHFNGILLHRFSMTETGLLAVGRVAKDDPPAVPPGRPVADKRLSLDENGRLVVQSEFLATGYWRKADSAFRGVFRTGDLGEILPDGSFVHRGRADRQVKIRGYRVEPAEIEAVLRALPGVRDAVVTTEGDAQLAAFVVTATQTESDLRVALEAILPEWKIPSAIRVVAELPVNPAGKVSRARGSSGEDALEQIWKELLKRDDLDPDISFFHQGGHSLLALVMLDRVEKAYAVRLDPAVLFRHNTLRAFRTALGEKVSAPIEEPLVTLRAGPGAPLVLAPSPAGDSLWAVELLKRLDPRWPVKALVPPPRAGPPRRFEEIAALHAEALIRAQPEGPIRLLGYSVGGRLAFAVACALAARGRAPMFVGIVDIEPEPRRYSAGRLLGGIVRWFPQFCANLPGFLVDHVLTNPSASRGAILRQKITALARILHGSADPDRRDYWAHFLDSKQYRQLPADRRAAWDEMVAAVRMYRPARFAGAVDLFRTRARPLLRPVPSDYGWGVWAAPARVHRIPRADHEHLMIEPHVRALAAKLNAALAEAG